MQSNRPLVAEVKDQNEPTSFWRGLGMFLLGCTGIGALYMWARTYTVPPGKVGVITNNRTGEVQVLQKGMHCLLSPFKTFNFALPDINQIVFEPYKGIKARASCGTEITATVNIRYQIKDPKAIVTKINGDFKEDVWNAIESCVSGVLREENIDYRTLCSARSPQMIASDASATAESGETKRSTQRPELPLAATTSSDSKASSISKLGESLLKKLQEICAGWGIEFSLVQIIDPKATDKQVEARFEESTRIINDATNRLAAAEAEKRRKEIEAAAHAAQTKILAIGQAEATITEAKANAERIKITTEAQKARLASLAEAIQGNQAAAQALALDTQISVAREFSATKGMLAIGPGAASTPFNMFAPPQVLPAVSHSSDLLPTARA
jgi:regulator of protease activity HflC (stomatin/prohibitin superfamily)